MKDLQLYFQCWVEVTKQSRYRDKWLTDETYFRAIKAQFPTLGDSFDRGKRNRAISVCGGATLDDFSDGNKTGMFRRTAKGVDPFGNPSRSIWGYTTTDLFRFSGSKIDFFSGISIVRLSLFVENLFRSSGSKMARIFIVSYVV
jgi:hypothetical protein